MLSEQEALKILFQDSELRVRANRVYDWLKVNLPYRCGVRLGKDRLSFLVGNYRPAAIKKRGNAVRLEMCFVGALPSAFASTGFRWLTLDDTYEGWVEVRSSLPLTTEDVDSFRRACERIGEVAPKSRTWMCNVRAEWPI
ncbi:MAG: hypothetical protein C4575_12720 [Desulforudis sp.]|jgi:hypothetical protein|nr:MAG: hypothetical protein C4575_12720 [Desulforudis sp.]